MPDPRERLRRFRPCPRCKRAAPFQGGEVLDTGRRRGRQRGFESIDKRVQDRSRCQVWVARVGIHVKFGVERPHDRRAEPLYCGDAPFFPHKQCGLLGRCHIGPMPQTPIRAGKPCHARAERPKCRIDRLTNNHQWSSGRGHRPARRRLVGEVRLQIMYCEFILSLFRAERLRPHREWPAPYPQVPSAETSAREDPSCGCGLER